MKFFIPILIVFVVVSSTVEAAFISEDHLAPANWDEIGATITGLSQQGIYTPALVQSNGMIWHRGAFTAIVASEETYWWAFRLKASDKASIVFRDVSARQQNSLQLLNGNVSIGSQVIGQMTVVTSYESVGDGVYVISGTFTPNRSGEIQFGIGSNNVTTGSSIEVLAGGIATSQSDLEVIVASQLVEPPLVIPAVIPILSYGQSVSVGGRNAAYPSGSVRERINQETSPYIYTYDRGQTALQRIESVQTQFVSAGAVVNVTETHDPGMLDTLVQRFLDSSDTSPILVGMSGGRGGRAIQELAIPENGIVTSVDEGMQLTETGDFFAVQTRLSNGSRYDIYVNTGDAAVLSLTTPDGRRPDAYQRLLEEFRAARDLAAANDMPFGNTVIFNWTQGQANEYEVLPYGYEHHLARLIEMLERDLSDNPGSTTTLITLVNQVSNVRSRDQRPVDYLHPKAQLEVVLKNPTVHFGLPEYSLNIQYPESILAVGSHLNNLGYRIMGEQIAHQLFDILTTGSSSLPHITAHSLVNGPASYIDVHFSGLQGHLVDDHSIFTKVYSSSPVVTARVQNVFTYFCAQGVGPTACATATPNTALYPKNFGFELLTTNYTAAPVSITNAQIRDRDTVRLYLSAPVTTPLLLSLGSKPQFTSGSRFRTFGTTLRDSVTYQITSKTQNWGDLSQYRSARYAPLQTIQIGAVQ